VDLNIASQTWHGFPSVAFVCACVFALLLALLFVLFVRGKKNLFETKFVCVFVRGLTKLHYTPKTTNLNPEQGYFTEQRALGGAGSFKICRSSLLEMF
jgi:hypothetical protein